MVVLVVGHLDHGLFLHRDHHDRIFVQPSFHHQQLVLGLPLLVVPSFLLPKSKMNIMLVLTILLPLVLVHF